MGLRSQNRGSRGGDKSRTPKRGAGHKGSPLPMCAQGAASPRDIGPAARHYPDVTIVVYHSGYNGETVGPYPGADKITSADRTVDALVKSLRENGWDASPFVPPRLEHRHAPHRYRTIGS